MTQKNKKIISAKVVENVYPDIPYIGKLLYNTNISPGVSHAYYALIPKAEHGKTPFSYCIKGAYPLTLDWEMLQLNIQNKTEPYNKVTQKQIDKALHDFADGFKEGYYNFENDKINSKLFKDDATKAQVIFDIATSWLLTDRGFNISRDEGVGYFDTWKSAGKEGGYYYRAWYLILENHSVFEPLFLNAPTEQTITYCSDNSITVQGNTYYFPFDGYHTCTNISLLFDALCKPDVTALSLQFYPDLIFDEKFNGHSGFAAIVSNIIHTLAEWAINNIHKREKRKEKLLDWLVSECEKRALQFKEPETQPEKMSIATKLVSHFSKIELIITGNRIEGIKEIDLTNEWDVFNDELNEYINTIPNIHNAKLWLPIVKRILENEEEMFNSAKSLVNAIDLYKKGRLHINKKPPTQDEYKEMIRYCFVQIVTGYSWCSQMYITNWAGLGEEKHHINFDKSCNGLEISEKFVKDFFDLINTKKWYISKVVKTLEAIVNNDMPEQNIQPEYNAAEYAAKKMTQINETDKTKQQDRKAQKQLSYKSLIDDNSYSPNVDDFKEKALIESLDKSNPAHYPKFLRGEKERYTNAIGYLNIYGNSDAENTLQNSYFEILSFINAEISERLSKDTLMIDNVNDELKTEFRKGSVK